MTRKEAIKVLETSNEYHHMIGDLPHSTKSKEAFKMAIEALEQEPCDKCEVGNPCLYCKHEFEPQESEDEDG